MYAFVNQSMGKNVLKNHRITCSRCVMDVAQTSKGRYFHFIFIFHFVKMIHIISHYWLKLYYNY